MFALLAMKGVLLPQILELWDVSKTQFGLLLSIYGLASNFMYVALSWAQDRFAPQKLIAMSHDYWRDYHLLLGKNLGL